MTVRLAPASWKWCGWNDDCGTKWSLKFGSLQNIHGCIWSFPKHWCLENVPGFKSLKEILYTLGLQDWYIKRNTIVFPCSRIWVVAVLPTITLLASVAHVGLGRRIAFKACRKAAFVVAMDQSLQGHLNRTRFQGLFAWPEGLCACLGQVSVTYALTLCVISLSIECPLRKVTCITTLGSPGSTEKKDKTHSPELPWRAEMT